MNSIHLVRPAESKHSPRKFKPTVQALLSQSDQSLHENNTIIERPNISPWQSQSDEPFIRLHKHYAEPVKRDTILLDLTNNDVLPALDYALSMLEAEQETSSDCPLQSSSRSHRSTSPTFSFSTSGTLPRYAFAPVPWKEASTSHVCNSPTCCHTRHPAVTTYPLDPPEFAHVFSPKRSSSDSFCRKSIPHSIPFPTTPASPKPGTRIPLLQRKPRLGQLTTETITLDMRDPFIFGNPSNLTLVRSTSALDSRQECTSCKSTTSVNTLESSWSTSSPRRPALPSTPKFLSSPRKHRLGTLSRNGSITASLKKPLLNIRRTLSHSDYDVNDEYRR